MKVAARALSLGGILLASTAISSMAWGQEAPAEPQEATAAAGGQDIIVTAQRREQRLQDVPVAITAATADQLNAAGITNTEKLTTVVPGLVMTQQRTGYTPYLRGVGTQNTLPGDEPNVATYVDGVYMASAAGIIFDMNNIERIEVLRGPQGTLYGRNATGGLISIITRKPSHDTAVEGMISYGNYNTVAGQLYATTGLTDNLAIDLALTGKHQGDGFGRNVVLDRDVYYHRTWGARSKLLWEPSDSATITLSADYTKKSSDFGATRGVYPGTVTIPGSNILDPTAPIIDPPTVGDCFRCAYHDVAKRPVTELYGTSMVANFDLGFASLTSTTAWRHVFSDYFTDTDGGAPQLSDVYLREKTDTIQQELLLNGDAGRLNYTAGLFIFYSDANTLVFIRNKYAAPVNFDRLNDTTTLSYAPFAQLTYDFGQGTSLTAGLRYTSDKRTYDGFQASSFFSQRDYALAGTSGPVQLTQNEDRTYRKVTWRVGVDHKFSPNFMVYANASRGFKSGAFNTSTIATPPVRPETLDSYEIGFKSTLWDNQLTLNASAFHYDYKDIQLFAVSGPTAFLLNAASARVQGVDVEAAFSPRLDTGDLTLSAKLGWLPKAKYRSFPGAQFFYELPATCAAGNTGPPTGGNLQCIDDAAGNRMISAPKLSATFSAAYSVPVSEDDRLAFNAVLSHNSGYWYEPGNVIGQKSFQLLNGSIAYYINDDRFAVRLFGTNLLNKKWVSSVQASTFSFSTYPADPRTYGVAVEFKF
jgi:Outer membrane receptor proteins, mostly Fe transport